ncbi:MAG: DUF1566 domain-containing protein, partial [Clostridia bacterium]|nr:DUF1566 domain-containing protein [Clostridia bacterium]
NVLFAFTASAQNTGYINGHEYVDLGLSVKWATCNVGASSPEGYGNYYAWGEISTKSSYDMGNSMTYGVIMGSIAGNSSYDAARANWGNSWRLPTKAEIEELVTRCSYTWITIEDHSGYKVTGPNGNSIFLPAAGYRKESGHFYGAGDDGYYWSGTPDESNANNVAGLSFDSGRNNGWLGRAQFARSFYERYQGRSVRPVVANDTTSSGDPVKKIVSSPTSTINGHGYVDLGLSVKWATCNVGASSPEGFGNFYAWGEIKPTSSYDVDNCKTYNKKIRDIAGNSRYDAARANWGGTWRMPTESEIDELKRECEWKRCTIFGGYMAWKVIGPSGKSILLPAAGYCRDSLCYRTGDYGGYWSSTPDESSTQGNSAGRRARLLYGSSTPDESGTQDAYQLFLLEHNFGGGKGKRSDGLSVRPVVANDTINSDEPLEIEDEPEKMMVSGTINDHEYVDLGLSVKWATCNVGASSPSDYGDYYAWGDTKTKSKYTIFNSSTYNKKKMDDIAGNESYDVARATWGGTWRMPTKAEIQELVRKCTIISTTIDGVNGRMVTGPNGNSIFFPAAGWRYGKSLDDAGEYFYYWSSTPYERGAEDAYNLDFRPSRWCYGFSSGDSYYKRYQGCSVRPVSE